MRLTLDQHVDWPRIIADLRKAGHTHATIAKRIGAHEQRVRKWQEIESQPRHDDGERLLALWCVVMTRERHTAPLVSRYAAR
jgi:hypothetical protein